MVIDTVLCEINKVQTTVDMGGRITLDVGSDSAKLIAMLTAIKMQGDGLVRVTFERSIDARDI